MIISEDLGENVPSPFLKLADPFRNGSVFACSDADSGAVMRRQRVNKELFRNRLNAAC